jgi:hypothetical protein
MSNIVKFNQVEEKIIAIRGQSVILDSDVAELYGITTKEVNQTIKNIPEKFLNGYIFGLTQSEWDRLRSKILTAK